MDFSEWVYSSLSSFPSEIFTTDSVPGVMFGRTISCCGSTVIFHAVALSHVSVSSHIGLHLQIIWYRLLVDFLSDLVDPAAPSPIPTEPESGRS